MPANEYEFEQLQLFIEDKLKRLGRGRQLTVYYGIYQIKDATMPVALMCDRVNLALRQVKRNDNTNYTIYQDSWHCSALNEHQLVNEMVAALAQERFRVYLQPIYNLQTERIISAEALVRWNHPTKGIILPASSTMVLL